MTQSRKAVGRYEILEKVGTGPVGVVYKASDPIVGLTRALKVFPVSPRSESAAAWLYRQAGRWADLSHPNIVTLFDIGEQDGVPFLVMEWLEGETIASLLDRSDRLEPQLALRLLTQVASALDYAQGKQVVHGNLKPSNLFVTRDGQAKVSDFGLAWPSDEEGVIGGGVDHLSPEQVMGWGLDARSDVFSLGVCAFEMLSGERPFHGDSLPATVLNILELDPAEPGQLEGSGFSREAWREVFGSALAKAPERRYPTARDFALDLTRRLGPSAGRSEATEAETSREPSLSAQTGTWVRDDSGEWVAAPPSEPATPAARAPAPVMSGPAGLVTGAVGLVLQAARSVSRRVKDYFGRRHREAPPVRTIAGDPALDAVETSVFAPATVRPGESFLVQVFAHLLEQAGQAAKTATLFDGAATKRGLRTLARRVARGATLMFDLRIPGLAVDDPVQSLVWNGQPESVQFGGQVPDDLTVPTVVVGTVTVSLDSVPVGHVKFKLGIEWSAARPREDEPRCEARHYAAAFISYASKDRNEVLARVQMLDSLKIRYFQDVLSLDPGDRWQQQLYRHIDDCDLFLLFWSTAARESEWVLKEVRYALERKRGDDLAPPEIKPVILEGPPPVPPPPELAHLHFNDRVLYFMSPRPS